MKNSIAVLSLGFFVCTLFFGKKAYSQIQILESSKKIEVGKLKAGYITIAE
jgi:hypothetical protein